MPNLFAACRVDGKPLVKRVSLNAALQQAVIDPPKTFAQETCTEVPFTGNWNPDPEEILTIDIPQEAQVFETAIRENVYGSTQYRHRAFHGGRNRSTTPLFRNGRARVLVQRAHFAAGVVEAFFTVSGRKRFSKIDRNRIHSGLEVGLHT